MFIGTFMSEPMMINGEGGMFEHPLDVDEKLFKLSRAPSDYVKTQIAVVWAGLVRAHDLPREKWTFVVSQAAQKAFGLPEIVSYEP